VLTSSHIALSESGWIDNELGLKWIKECFEPETRWSQNREWRMLIFDGHASHITTKAIEFCAAHQIMLLYLPPHSIHLLQPCIFEPLLLAYKKGVQCRYRFGVTYSIDKVNFLEIYQQSRVEAITQENI